MKKTVALIFVISITSSVFADYWTQLANFPAAGRQLASGFSIGSKGYVTCGEGGLYYNDLWEYDPANNLWTQLADLPGPGRYGAVVFTINDKGYVGTGAYPLLDDLWEYDPVTNTWTQKSSIIGARGFACGFAIGTKGYIGCGMNTPDFWEWDQPTDTWTQKSSCPVTRIQGVGFAISGKGYFSTGDYLNDLWQYDPVANLWVQKANLPAMGRVDATAFVICDKAYLGSGGDGPLMNDFWEYDPVLDQWLQKANTPNGLRDDCPSFSIGQKGYFGLGDNGIYQLDFWEYTPDQCVNIPPVAAFTAPNHICPGTCTNFNNISVNATTYLWIFPGANPSTSTDVDPTNICYNSPGVYAVSLIASNATTSDILQLNNYITVYPYPAPQGIAQTGDTLFANAGANSYQWYYGGNLIPGATDYYYVIIQNGDYNVVATDQNGCEVEAVIFDVVDVQLLAQAAEISIFPNPVNDKLIIQKLEIVCGACEISIFNLIGEKMFSAVQSGIQPVRPGESVQWQIDCHVLSPGLYFIEINAGDKKFYRKFLKSDNK
ncbi:hypothetical protein BH11BAC1_BH11BAC1_22000 [soil metagenome]